MSERLAGRVVVITGAAQGQGASEALACAAAGATVIATDVKEVPGPGDPELAARIHPRHLDVSDKTQWDELAAWTAAEFGRIDGLVNNAGMTSRVRLGDVELEDWNRLLAVNVTGALLGVQALLPQMEAGASIVNVGSVAALTGHYTVAYTTSKWALRGLTKVIATELGPRGIRANAIHPGFIDTPMTASAPASFRRVNEGLTPLERAGRPEEVAALVLFLLSEESSFVSGVDVPIDGGFTDGGAAKTISDALRAEIP